MIRFDDSVHDDQHRAASCQQEYRQTAQQRYPGLTSQICLGYGIDVFGLPYSRLRSYAFPIGSDPSDVAELAKVA